MNLNYSSHIREVETKSANECFFWVFFSSAVPFSRTNPESWLCWCQCSVEPEGAGLSLTIDLRKNPERVSFRPRGSAAHTNVDEGRNGSDCVVSALWPTECAFKEDSQAARISQRISFSWHWAKAACIHSGKRVHYENVKPGPCCCFFFSLSLHKEPVARLLKSLLSPF